MSNKPILTLDMNEKIYLAVAKDTTNDLAFVYTLACNKDKKTNLYDVFATPQVHTFRTKGGAHVFYKTVEQIVVRNESLEVYKSLFDFNKKQIEEFMAHIR
ncbi:MAG: hypothetical protein IKZ34_04125 [Alphaproteobacteria bacterium]|nr:hypothetical protein [Alphaproteobacteria bacterium]